MKPDPKRSDYEPKDTVGIDVGPPGAERSVRAPWCLACGREPQEFHVQCLDDAGERRLEQPIYRWHGLCATCEGESTLACMALLLERMARQATNAAWYEHDLKAEAESLREADRG